ncbi:MAG TPA: DUF1232 domain-containing protein [Roseiflexaceae bacterium]|nr:DUF1232 domain-containing protein [Roseiflexaceae bacterium]
MSTPPPTPIQRWRQRVRALKQETYALFLAARDPRTPLAARLLVATIVAYALSPIDLIPDFIPVLGLLDVLVLLPAVIALALRLIPADVLASSRVEAAKRLDGTRPQSRAAAVVIVLIWLALTLVSLRYVIGWFG